MRKWHNVFGLLSGCAILIGINHISKGDEWQYFIHLVEALFVGMSYFVYQSMRSN